MKANKLNQLLEPNLHPRGLLRIIILITRRLLLLRRNHHKKHLPGSQALLPPQTTTQKIAPKHDVYKCVHRIIAAYERYREGAFAQAAMDTAMDVGSAGVGPEEERVTPELVRRLVEEVLVGGTYECVLFCSKSFLPPDAVECS